MKEVRRLRPGTDNKLFLAYKELVLEAALEIIEPCKGHGRSHIAAMIGQYTAEQHNRMTEVCAGIKETPQTPDDQHDFSIRTAVAGLLLGAIVKVVEDPNTQWDHGTLFYYQLRNHLENLESCTGAALVIRLSGEK